MPVPLLIHLPHSSVAISEEERKKFLLGEAGLQAELLRVTDRYTEELFGYPEAVVHSNPHSRLVVDPERFRDDREEGMSRFGMGAIYTHSSDGRLIRDIGDERSEELKRKYYDPYHEELERKTQQLLQEFGHCLILDGHSFPEKPLEFERDKNPDRPDICIGTCDFHTPEKIVQALERSITGRGLTVKRNVPFAGTMVPMRYYRKDGRVASVMIEVNRRLYMDETTGGKLPGFEAVKLFVRELVRVAFDEFI